MLHHSYFAISSNPSSLDIPKNLKAGGTNRSGTIATESDSASSSGQFTWLLVAKLVIALVSFALSGHARAEFAVDWWQSLEDSITRKSSGFSAVEVTPSGETYVLGMSYGWTGELMLAALNQAGQTRWQAVVDDARTLEHRKASGQPPSVIVDNLGSPIVAFPCTNQYSPRSCLVKFSSQTGAVLWRSRTDVSADNCTLKSAGAFGFYKYCSNSPIQRLNWDGTVAWTSANGYSLSVVQPLASGNIVRGGYGAGTIQSLSAQTGAVLWTAAIPGDVISYRPLTDGGLVVQAQRMVGNQSYLDTLYRISANGTIVGTHDRPVPGYSYSAQRMFVVGNTIVRHTVIESGRLRIATTTGGALIWEKSSGTVDEIVSTSNAAYLRESSDGFNTTFVPLNLQDGTLDTPSVQVSGVGFRIFEQASSLILTRANSGVFGDNLLEKYSSTLSREWQSDLFQLTQQLLVQTNPVGLDYCPRLRHLDSGRWLVLSKRFNPLNSNGEPVAQVFDAAGTPSPSVGLGVGSICPATFDDSTDFFALGLDGLLRQFHLDGTIGWTASPPGLSSVYASFGVGLRNGTMVVHVDTPSGALAWRYDRSGVLLSGSQPSSIPTSLSLIVPGSGSTFYGLHGVGQISQFGTSNTPLWTITSGTPSCPLSFTKALATANGQLLLSYVDCRAMPGVLRVAADGSILWQSNLPRGSLPYQFSVRALAEAPNGNAIIAGCAAQPSFFPTDPPQRGTNSLVLVLSPDGNATWSKELDIFAQAAECVEGISVRPDNKILISVSSDATCGASTLLRLSSDGQLEYGDSISLANPRVLARDMIAFSNSKLYALGDGFDESTRRQTTSLRKISLDSGRCSVDANGDGQTNLLSDGLPVAKAMFGFDVSPGDYVPVVQNSCAFGLELINARTKAVAGVHPYQSQMPGPADIDGDGQVSPLVDGLLLLRALLGLQGQALTAGIRFSPVSTRTTSNDILSYLRGCGATGI